MPWNDNSNPGGKPGPKPTGNPGPWGAPPSGGGGGGGDRGGSGGPFGGPGRQPPKRPTPGGPDLSDIGRQINKRLNDYFGGGSGGGVKPAAIAVGVGAIAAIWALSGVYIVQSDEQAIVTTFGSYSGWNGPGLNYHLPAPIQKVEKVSVTRLRRTDIGGQTGGADQPDESLMLTADNNIIDLDFTVQWKVSRASDFVFQLADPETAIRAVAESAMREIVGRTNLEPLLGAQRGQVQDETRALLQTTLDAYKAGVDIDEVLIRTASSPQPVVDAFRAVTNAEQEAEATKNRARGEANTLMGDAQAYAARARLEAEGDAARFNALYVQYKLAPAVTRDRLYIETMQRILMKSNKVIVDSKGANTPVILPADLFRPRMPPATGTPPVPMAAPAAGANR